MTAQELQKRNEKAQNLRVIQAEEGTYFVESEEGKICYKVFYQDGKENYCSCGDFAKSGKADPQFKCKHILAIMNSEHDFEKAHFLEKVRPKLDERFIIQVDGQDFCKYAGLLDLAHQKRLSHLDVEILQYPTKQNGMTGHLQSQSSDSHRRYIFGYWRCVSHKLQFKSCQASDSNGQHQGEGSLL